MHEMKLKRSSIHGSFAWLWIAPNGVEFYLTKTYDNTFVWYRKDEYISSMAFDTLEELKQHLANSFFSDD